jgi:hypothetical protein
MSEDNFSFASLILPEELFNYFDVLSIEKDPFSVKIHLDEKNELPEELKGRNLHSKGFHKPIVVQDFPLRERMVFLHIRRRRWLDQDTQESLSRDWKLVAKGSRYTEGFATFLKELYGSFSY